MGSISERSDVNQTIMWRLVENRLSRTHVLCPYCLMISHRGVEAHTAALEASFIRVGVRPGYNSSLPGFGCRSH